MKASYMKTIIIFSFIWFSLTKADSCSYPCNYCCINNECRERSQWMSLVEGFIGIILGAIGWLGWVTILWCYLRLYDNNRLFKKALEKILKANKHNAKISNETREDIINRINIAKVIDISHNLNLSKESACGVSYAGRNMVFSKYYVLVEQFWNNQKILKIMNIKNNLM